MKTQLLNTLFGIIGISIFAGTINTSHPYRYQYIPSASQNAASCGYYALANAAAVQQLFNEKQAINEHNIKQIAIQELTEHFTPFFKDEYDNLTPDQKAQISFLSYAEHQTPLLSTLDTLLLDESGPRSTFFTLFKNEHNELQNAYAIQCINEKDNLIRIVDCLNNDRTGLALSRIKNEDRSIIHILYNLGSDNSGHWVYIGIIKQPGQEPYIIHLNSTNNDSYERSTEFKLVVDHIQKCIHDQKALVTEKQEEAIKTEDDINLAQAIANSLQDAENIKMKQNAVSDEDNLKYALKIQSEEDSLYCQALQTKEEDSLYAFNLNKEEEELQRLEDYDFALALALAEEDN